MASKFQASTATVSRMVEGQVDRRVVEVVAARMREVPVVVLQGPRSVGKSTVLNQIAREHGATVVNLDVPGMRRTVEADSTQFVEGPGSVFIDEYQRVPDILDAIKAEVDADYRPGRFLLTGSTRFDALPRSSQALTGRIHFVSILPFSQGETRRGPRRFPRHCSHRTRTVPDRDRLSAQP